jgi:hypothetical protein
MHVKFQRLIIASTCVLASAITFAQSPAPGTQSSDQSQKSTGPGMSMQHKAGGMHQNHGCCSSKDTSGWSMMSKTERSEHRDKMRSMKTYDECKAYADEHHAKMMERAKEKGRTPPMTPGRDACAWLKK